MPPEADRFVADFDAPLVEKVLDVPKRQREPDVKLDGQADDLGLSLGVAKWGALGHGRKLRNRPTRLKPSSFDTTFYLGDHALSVGYID